MRTSHRKRIFGIGAPKTGTHTLAALFTNQVRAGHELDAKDIISRLLKYTDSAPYPGLLRYLANRDKVRSLQLDVSSVYLHLLTDLQQLFPQSKYILTVRHPCRWVRSLVDHQLRWPARKTWRKFQEYRFGGNVVYHPEESALQQKGLYPLGNYFQYWAKTILNSIAGVTSERLLIIETEKINLRKQALAEFCELPRRCLSPEDIHKRKNSLRTGMIESLDQDFVRNTCIEHCAAACRVLEENHGIPFELSR
jgi:hypothetical protein